MKEDKSFCLNDALEIDTLAAQYSIDQRVQVFDILPAAQAQQLFSHLENHVEYKNALFLDSKVGEVSRAKWQSYSEAEKQSLMTRIMSQASEGVGFWYGRSGMSSQSAGVLKQVYEWLNSEELLAKIRLITGVDDLRSASGQVTRFLPGEFLTRHKDVVAGESRKIAYVLNLTDRWHPDWGGLLQFYEQSGKPRDAWTPRFNSLNLFHVKHIHSVTCIAPFAARPRYAVSGWFSTAESV